MPAGKAVKVLPFEDEQSYQLNTGQREIIILMIFFYATEKHQV